MSAHSASLELLAMWNMCDQCQHPDRMKMLLVQATGEVLLPDLAHGNTPITRRQVAKIRDHWHTLHHAPENW